MEQENITKEKIDMLDKIYRMRLEEMEQESNQDRKVLEPQLNKIRLEEIENQIQNKAIQKEEIIQGIEKLIENYEIQISYYSEKNYKQGFKDGLGLYNQCLEEK